MPEVVSFSSYGARSAFGVQSGSLQYDAVATAAADFGNWLATSAGGRSSAAGPPVDRHAKDAAYQVGYLPAANLIYTHAQVQKLRLEALHEQASHYGRGIPQIWGKFKLGGNVIWAGDFYVAPANSILPPPSIQPAPGDPIPVGDVWRADVAILLCKGPVHTVSCIWADDIVIYADGDLIANGSATLGTGFTYYDIAIYHGNETQGPDGTMAAALGDVPAYRGLCYVVIRGLDLTRWGNKLPTFQFAIHTSSRGSVQIQHVLEDVAGQCGMTSDDYDFTAATDYT